MNNEIKISAALFSRIKQLVTTHPNSNFLAALNQQLRTTVALVSECNLVGEPEGNGPVRRHEIILKRMKTHGDIKTCLTETGYGLLKRTGQTPDKVQLWVL
jgi:hypothetical protein